MGNAGPFLSPGPGGERGNGGHGGKPGTSRIVFSRLSGDLPLPARPDAEHDSAADRSLYRIEAPGTGRGKADGKIHLNNEFLFVYGVGL